MVGNKKTAQQKTAEKKARKAAIEKKKDNARRLKAAAVQEALKGNTKGAKSIMGFAKGMKKNNKNK